MSENSEDEFLPEINVGVIGKKWIPSTEDRKEVSLKYDKIPKHHKVLTDEKEVERLGSGKIDLP